MTGLLRLSWRLALAGGPGRWIATAAGCALVVVMGLAAQAVPAAMYPEGETFAPFYRVQFTVIIIACLFPAIGLLATTSRLTSDLRDRRLATLRLIGLSPSRAAGVAALEMLWPAIGGALAGWLAFYPLAWLGDRVVELGPAWFHSGLHVSPWAAVATSTGVVLLGVFCTALPTLRGLRDPLPSAKTAVARRLSPWRCLILVPAWLPLAWLAWMYADPVRRVQVEQGAAWFVIFGGGACAVVAILIVPPVLVVALARLLVKHPITPRLVGRALQVTPASVSRQASGFGVMALLLIAAVGLSGLFLAIPDVQAGARAVGDGPQRVVLMGADDLDGATLAELANLDYVQQVVAVPDVAVADEASDLVVGPPQIFVGTCDELATVVVLTEACDESGVSVLGIRFDSGPEVEYGVSSSFPTTDEGLAAVVDGRDVLLPLSAGEIYPGVLGYDYDATREAWGSNAIPTIFIPSGLARSGTVLGAVVIADGGTAPAEALQGWGADHGLTTTRTDLSDLIATQQALVTIWTLLAIAAFVTLASFSVATVDRIREQRPRLARLVALGVPQRLTRRSQLLQNAIGLLAALVVAVPAGFLLVPAMAALDPQQAPEIPSYAPSMVALLLAIGSAVLLSAAAASLAARVHVTADLLRTE